MLKGVNNFINSPVEHKCSKAFTWSSRRVETPNKSSSCTTIFDHQICLMQLMFCHCVYSLSRNIVWNPLDSHDTLVSAKILYDLDEDPYEDLSLIHI